MERSITCPCPAPWAATLACQELDESSLLETDSILRTQLDRRDTLALARVRVRADVPGQRAVGAKTPGQGGATQLELRESTSDRSSQRVELQVALKPAWVILHAWRRQLSNLPWACECTSARVYECTSVRVYECTSVRVCECGRRPRVRQLAVSVGSQLTHAWGLAMTSC